MIEAVVESIRFSPQSDSRVVFLKERSGDRHLPIWIGEFEAQAIAMELQGLPSPRPMPYDLMRSMITELSGTVERVVVNDLAQDVYYARIVINSDGRVFEVDARPSDAIALAVRCGCSIFVEESVLARAGISLETETDDEVTDGEPERTAKASPEDDDKLSILTLDRPVKEGSVIS